MVDTAVLLASYVSDVSDVAETHVNGRHGFALRAADRPDRLKLRADWKTRTWSWMLS
jgi:hypothetical protein